MDEVVKVKKSIESIEEKIRSLNKEISRISERYELDPDITSALKLIVSDIQCLMDLSEITNKRIEKLSVGVHYPYV